MEEFSAVLQSGEGSFHVSVGCVKTSGQSGFCWTPDVERPRAEAARHFPLALQWSSNDTSESMVERRYGKGGGRCMSKWCASRMHYIKGLNPQHLKARAENTTFVCDSRKSIFHCWFHYGLHQRVGSFVWVHRRKKIALILYSSLKLLKGRLERFKWYFHTGKKYFIF